MEQVSYTQGKNSDGGVEEGSFEKGLMVKLTGVIGYWKIVTILSECD